MQRTTENQPRGIRWTLFNTLEDLDFADDLALLSQTGWRHQEGYSEQTEQSQERLQESERSLEIITVQHQDEVRAAYCRPFFTDQTAGE